MGLRCRSRSRRRNSSGRKTAGQSAGREQARALLESAGRLGVQPVADTLFAEGPDVFTRDERGAITETNVEYLGEARNHLTGVAEGLHG